MDQVLKTKLWSLILGILVFANIATLAGFWYFKFHNGEQVALPQGGPGGAAQFIIKQVGFDERQQHDYLELVSEHQQQVSVIRKKLRMNKDALFNSFGDPSFTQLALDTLTSAIGDCEKRLDMLTYRHFKQVRALCDAQQKIKFDNIIKQVMRMMGPMPGGRPPGPPPMGGNGNFPPPPPDGQGPPPSQ